MTPREEVFKQAMSMIGKFNEFPGVKDNPEIVNMFKVVIGESMPDSTPWCAVALGYTLHLAGFRFIETALARGYLNYGQEVDSLANARQGDIVVLKRGGKSWMGHVGFFYEREGNDLLLIGGNQRNSYNIMRFNIKSHKHRLLSVRRVTEAQRLV